MLAKRGIAYVARRQPPVETALLYAADAALVICDRNYLKPVRRFYADFAARAPCRVVQVEGEVVVPVETASPKHEVAARTAAFYRSEDPGAPAVGDDPSPASDGISTDRISTDRISTGPEGSRE